MLIQTRSALLLIAAVLGAVALWWHGPIWQPEQYHRFADSRTWLGIPNAANVLSNLAFVAIGLWGCARVRQRRLELGAGLATAWGGFFIAALAAGFGSAYYHWAPSDAGLMIDRLPIAGACALLLCAFLGERGHVGWVRPWTVIAALLLATLSVMVWYLGQLDGPGDLRAYAFVQFLPMLLIPLALLSYPEAGVRKRDWWVVLGLYALAKGAELGDHALMDAWGVSGHTLKHLLAAAAGGWLAARVGTAALTAQPAQPPSAAATRSRSTPPQQRNTSATTGS